MPSTWSDIQSLVTVLAILVGAFWTWLLFVKGRQRWPQARCRHVFAAEILPGGRVLLNAKIGIENVGSRLIIVDRVVGRVQRIAPATDLVNKQIELYRGSGDSIRINWPLLPNGKRVAKFKKGNEFEIEPGELDWIELDFLLPASLSTFRFYSFVDNVGKKKRHFWSRGKELGWPASSIVQIADGKIVSRQTERAKRMMTEAHEHSTPQTDEQRQQVIEQDPPEEYPEFQEQTTEEPDPPTEAEEDSQ